MFLRRKVVWALATFAWLAEGTILSLEDTEASFGSFEVAHETCIETGLMKDEVNMRSYIEIVSIGALFVGAHDITLRL